jgi:hypothetical protein
MSPLPECYPAVPMWAVWTALALLVLCPLLYVFVSASLEGKE